MYFKNIVNSLIYLFGIEKTSKKVQPPNNKNIKRSRSFVIGVLNKHKTTGKQLVQVHPQYSNILQTKCTPIFPSLQNISDGVLHRYIIMCVLDILQRAIQIRGERHIANCEHFTMRNGILYK